jgi:hypothetical protein
MGTPKSLLRAGKVKPALTRPGALPTAILQFVRHPRPLRRRSSRAAVVKFHDGGIASDSADPAL